MKVFFKNGERRRNGIQHLALDIDIARLGFLRPHNALQEAKFVIYVTQTLIGDGFMVRRKCLISVARSI